MTRFAARLVVASLAILCLVRPPLSLGDDAIPPGTVSSGETLDPAYYGPAIVEGMDAVLARDRARRPGADANPKARNGQQGIWVVPSSRATYYPHSGRHNVVNKWGDTRMGIAFPDAVDVQGAWFAGQGGGEGVWAAGIRVLGYRDGRHTCTTEWFPSVGRTPEWFAMELLDVDRIVIEARPVYGGAGWYAMDDLTYVPAAGQADQQPAAVVIDFEDCSFRQKLTGSSYAGLTWETGTGDFHTDQQGVPAPQTLPREEVQAPPAEEEEGGPRLTGTLPTLLLDFRGVIRGDAGSWSYPPDTCGAIGPDHFVEVVNRNFAVFRKDFGVMLINSHLGSFLPGSNGDPRVLFDQHSGRWIVTVPDFNTKLFLAVSLTDDPTGEWFKTDFLLSQGSDANCWSDYPTLGVDEDGIYVAAWMVGCGLSIFVIDKAPLIDPQPSLGTVTAFRGMPIETTQPVHTYGTAPSQYFVARRSSSAIRVRRVSGPINSPVQVEVGDVTIPNHSHPSDVPALGSSVPLDSVDARLMNAVYRDGFIWAAHTINLVNRAACRWYKIDVASLELADYGTVNDSSMHYFFPSIMVNAGGDAIMSFSGADSVHYAGAYYTGRKAEDLPGQMGQPVLLKAGVAPQNNIDSYGRNRWGDYSLCSLDPTNEVTMWTVQEFAHTSSGNDRWGTWIASLDYGDHAGPTPTPMTWQTPPLALGTSQLTMTATVASDETPPIEYFFFYWDDGGEGGDSSGWQMTTAYTDDGLVANTVHTYSVNARDGAIPHNLGTYSLPVSTATHIEAPTGLAAGVIGSGSVQVTATETFTNLTLGQSGLYFDWEETVSGTPVGDSGWVQAATVSAGGLAPETDYTFRVLARNQDGIQTVSAEAVFTTLPQTTCVCLGDLNADTAVDGRDITLFVEMFLGSQPVDPCADLALPTGADLDLADLQGFVVRLLNGPGCP